MKMLERLSFWRSGCHAHACVGMRLAVRSTPTQAWAWHSSGSYSIVRNAPLAAVLAACVLLTPSVRAAETPQAPAHEIAPGPFQPDWESLKQYQCPAWFRDAKFGIWAHWTAQCVPEQGDWYARSMYMQGTPDYNYHVKHYGHPSKFGFKDIDNLWKAERWDPEKLMRLYKRAGAKYFVALANHHDNFDCWNSKYQPWNARQRRTEEGPRRHLGKDRPGKRTAVRRDGPLLAILALVPSRLWPRRRGPVGRRPL